MNSAPPTSSIPFHPRHSVEEVEEGDTLSPKFDAEGLIPCVTTDHETGEVLMLGYMNAEALEMTARLAEAVYYSRSRKTLWHKGATSGLVQKVIEMRVDDDQDCVWLRVQVKGGASCHVGYRSCFYRSVPVGKPLSPESRLTFTEAAEAAAKQLEAYRLRVLMMQFDKNKDGRITKDEMSTNPFLFDRMDADKGGTVTAEELTAY